MATNVINPAARQLVVQNYFNLVQAIANKIKRRLPAHVDVEDLVQTGMIGLLEASNRYDASRLVDFSSYANGTRAHARTVKCPVKLRALNRP